MLFYVLLRNELNEFMLVPNARDELWPLHLTAQNQRSEVVRSALRTQFPHLFRALEPTLREFTVRPGPSGIHLLSTGHYCCIVPTAQFVTAREIKNGKTTSDEPRIIHPHACRLL